MNMIVIGVFIVGKKMEVLLESSALKELFVVCLLTNLLFLAAIKSERAT